MTRTGIYTRLSVDRDGTSESPERQRADCEALAAAKGFTVIDFYEDRDESGYSKRARRPEYRRLLKDIEAGKIETVIVWKLDRLTRQGVAGLAPFFKLGAAIVSVNESLDMTTPMGEGVAAVLASVAKQESENTSLRVKRAHRSAAEKGKLHSGGLRGYGYTRAGELVPEEANVIRESARRVFDGESFNVIARDLNERGVTTTTGRPWRASTLAKTLRQPRLAGIRQHGDETYAAAWEPILSVEQHKRLNETRQEPKVFRHPYHLLSGITFCGRCGQRMKVNTEARKGKPFARYSCLGGCGLAIVKEPVNEHVRDDLFRLLSAGEIVPDASSPENDAERLRALISDDREALNELSRDRYVNRVVSHEMFLAACSEIETRLRRNEEALEVAESEAREVAAARELRPGKLEDLLAWWERADEHERRDAVHGAIRSVTIRPATRRGNKFDRERIVIEYRFGFLSRVAQRYMDDTAA